MGFEVKLYSFSKRDNSTDRPSNEIMTATGNLRSGCGILNPTIEFNFGADSPAHYPVGGEHRKLNYAYIYQFGQRYYFIREWTWEAGLWTAHMEVDVLATYKANIGDSTLYVLRASNAHDGRITDLLYPAKTGCSFSSVTTNSPWLLNTGVFCVGIYNDSGRYGGINYYILTFDQLTRLCYSLLDVDLLSDNNLTWQGLSDNMVLSLVNPIQYIKSCVMLPVSAGAISNTVQMTDVLKVFNWATTLRPLMVDPNSDIVQRHSFRVPHHPNTSERGVYVNSAPFTSITLTIPPFGCIDIDSSVTCPSDPDDYVDVDVTAKIDTVTGKGVLEVMCRGIMLNRIESQIGIPIALSQVTRDYIGGATNAAGAIGSVISGFTGGGIGGAIAGAASGIGNAVESMMPRASTVGTTGAYVSNKGDWRLDLQFFIPVSDDNPHNGRPYCKKVNLGELGGYQMIQDGDVRTTGTKEEDEKIRAYLEGGYYYE